MAEQKYLKPLNILVIGIKDDSCVALVLHKYGHLKFRCIRSLIRFLISNINYFLNIIFIFDFASYVSSRKLLSAVMVISILGKKLVIYGIGNFCLILSKILNIDVSFKFGKYCFIQKIMIGNFYFDLENSYKSEKSKVINSDFIIKNLTIIKKYFLIY